MIQGLDVLGLAKFAKVAAQNWPAGAALGCFATTFGDSREAVKAVLNTGKCPLVRVQLIWSDTHTYGDKDIPEIKRLATQWSKLAAKYPAVEFLYSPFCEHKLLKPEKYLRIVAKIVGAPRVVNSVMSGGKLTEDFTNEVHGTKARPPSIPPGFNFSFDGQSANRANVNQMRDRMKKADLFFIWDCSYNGKSTDDDPTPRPLRKSYPNKALFNEIAGLLK